MKTTCIEDGSKKINNMPNLQSMSQAKGYGRLHNKSSQNEMCSCEIGRNSQITRSTLHANDHDLKSKLTRRSVLDLKAALFVPWGVVTTDFCPFFHFISHMASQSWTICDTCVGFRLLTQ